MYLILKTEEERAKYLNESYKKNSEMMRKSNKKQYKKRRKENLKRNKKYYANNTEKMKEMMRKYQKTEKGRLAFAKANRKRKSQLGFHPISFPLNVSFDWHHVNRNDVVAISRYIHRAIYHICGDDKLEGVLG